jgi:hypothetical protein
VGRDSCDDPACVDHVHIILDECNHLVMDDGAWCSDVTCLQTTLYWAECPTKEEGIDCNASYGDEYTYQWVQWEKNLAPPECANPNKNSQPVKQSTECSRWESPRGRCITGDECGGAYIAGPWLGKHEWICK